jgi:hypothetical protein
MFQRNILTPKCGSKMGDVISLKHLCIYIGLHYITSQMTVPFIAIAERSSNQTAPNSNKCTDLDLLRDWDLAGEVFREREPDFDL